MTSFTDIPLDDIKEFLIANNKSATNQPYLDTWELIKNDKSLTVPASISDFFLAQNLSKMEFPSYKMSKILASDVKDLSYIEQLQNLPKERIIRVLKYLNKLENDLNIFDMLPRDVSQFIVSELDIHSIQLICEISCNFSKFCRAHLQPILIKNLKCKTDIIINNFSMKQLIYLTKNLNKHTKKNLNILCKYHSLILKDNKIYDGDNVIHPEIFDDIIQLATSNNHALVLTSEGEVYVFGNNNFGQLGLNHNFDCDIPQLIDEISDVIYISVSDKHSMLLTSDNKVYITENNVFKKLELEKIIKISAGYSHSTALSSDGKVYVINDDNIGLLMEESDIVSISTGYDHSLLLTGKGLIYAYGKNDCGQLGPNLELIETPSIITGLDDIVHIAAGNKYSLVLTKEGCVFKFGLEGDTMNHSPIKISIEDIIIL